MQASPSGVEVSQARPPRQADDSVTGPSLIFIKFSVYGVYGFTQQIADKALTTTQHLVDRLILTYEVKCENKSRY
jgi:hypothetical protein